MQDVKTVISICYNLRPSDLLAMVCVCKDFKNILDECINPLAGEIWKNSRKQFTIFHDKEPPPRMRQQTFARLLTFEKGCQFCKTKLRTCTIYWIPGVRSCKECMVPRAFSESIFENTFKLDNEILGLIAPVTPSIQPKLVYYWGEHVKNIIAFLMKYDGNIQFDLNNLREQVENNYKEVQHYHDWLSNLHKLYIRVQEHYFDKLNEELNSEIFIRLQNEEEFKTIKSEIHANPFLIQDWPKYKARILRMFPRIYQSSLKRRMKQNSERIFRNQIKIVKGLRKLTYGTVERPLNKIISIWDPLYQYLAICPSYVNPPESDESVYTREFIEKTLLPILKKEADQLRATRVTPPPYLLDINGALRVGSLRSQPVFECRLCSKIEPSSLKNFRLHISISHKLEDSLKNIVSVAKLNCDAVVTHLFYAFFDSCN
ncbi:25249_t:CDS:2 [Racocetra persica]|uniref:25249_t:CDS:1 n=1 Tax=Racocetra persica TaxID=160502 RepID=A0ACA9KH94_9GLOM|nr:25249_t:CDS:2 [Racocetra persica]